MPFGTRTYIPTLVFLINQLYKYATKYQAVLETHFGEAQVTCLRSLLTCLADCIGVIVNAPPNP